METAGIEPAEDSSRKRLNVFDMSDGELRVFAVLRDADELWLELWQVAKRAGFGWQRASTAVSRLRARGLVVKRRRCGGLSRVEVSLARSGV